MDNTTKTTEKTEVETQTDTHAASGRPGVDNSDPAAAPTGK